MILLVHLLFGAAIGTIVNNIPLAIILAFLGHYFLDIFPHIEYPIRNADKKQWQHISCDTIKIAIDFLLGITIVFTFSNNQIIIYICALVAILPDGLTIINHILPNKILSIHENFHSENVHFLKDKKISYFWRIISQVLFIIVSVFLLKFK
ncbi:MAG: hypothetical protein WCK10_00565 [Candidatus Staskawiczbacteria bacterium]